MIDPLGADQMDVDPHTGPVWGYTKFSVFIFLFPFSMKSDTTRYLTPTTQQSGTLALNRPKNAAIRSDQRAILPASAMRHPGVLVLVSR